MAANYRKINYSIRPAKNIERKMLCESFQKLSPFAKVETYRYVGFGSTYFSDFVLFHKALNFTYMVSIEKDTGNRERFKFNVPYKCIDVIFGHSNGALPKLKWDCRSIVWLDYTCKLTSEVLADIKFLANKMLSGSILIVSLNAEPEELDAEKGIGARLTKLLEAIGPKKVPSDITDKTLGGWGTSEAFRQIINNEIAETLTARNGVLAPGARLSYSQLYNFQYADGDKMMTVGGILYDSGQQLHYEQCGFQHLDFTRPSSDAYKIEVPCLTFKEIRRLDEQLPRTVGDALSLPDVQEVDILKYEKLYRYFPSFTETSY
jgi:hypothetical protein